LIPFFVLSFVEFADWLDTGLDWAGLERLPLVFFRNNSMSCNRTPYMS
jgi:hypothetical protein